MSYPTYIMEILRQQAGLKKDDESKDNVLSNTKPMDALRARVAYRFGYAEWADDFIRWAKDCGLEIVERKDES